MRCVKCLKILRHATVRSQIWESTDRNAIILLIILFTFLSPPTHISLCLQHSYLSLSSLVSISSLLPISFSLSFFFISHSLSLSLHFGIITTDPTRLCAPLSLSLSLSLSFSLYFPVIVSLSFFSYHEEEGDSDLKQSSPIEARQSEPLLADLKLYLPRGNRRSLLVVLQALAADGWLSLIIDWSVGLGFCWRFWVFILFYFLFCWGFLIWNLLEDSMIVIVVCCDGCCYGSGCSSGCWFLGGGDCHWLCICIFAGFWGNILF